MFDIQCRLSHVCHAFPEPAEYIDWRTYLDIVVWYRSCFDNRTIPVRVTRNIFYTLATCISHHAIRIFFKAVDEYAIYAYTYT